MLFPDRKVKSCNFLFMGHRWDRRWGFWHLKNFLVKIPTLGYKINDKIPQPGAKDFSVSCNQSKLLMCQMSPPSSTKVSVKVPPLPHLPQGKYWQVHVNNIKAQMLCQNSPCITISKSTPLGKFVYPSVPWENIDRYMNAMCQLGT